MKMKDATAVVALTLAITAASAAPLSGAFSSDQPTTSAKKAPFILSLNRISADKGEVFRKGCHVGHHRLRSGACRFGDTRSGKKVVLFGDSHAMQWGPGLIHLAKKQGWQVIALTRASCTAALVNVDYYCDNWRGNSLERIRRIKPGLVLVASAANAGSYELFDNGSTLSRRSSEPLLESGMVRTLRKLRKWSGKTVVMRDQAVAPLNVTGCLRENRSRPGDCGFRASRPNAYSYDYKAARKVGGVGIVDPMPLLCPAGQCHAVDDRVLIYRNQSHLSASFVRSKYLWLAGKLGDPWAGSN